MAENSPDHPKGGLNQITRTGPQNPISSGEANSERSFLEELSAFGSWCALNPATVFLFVTLIGIFCVAYGWYHPFMVGTESTAVWAWRAWDPNGEQSHGKIVPLIALALIWIARDDLKRVAGRGSNWGLFWIFVGVVFFLLASRTLQPRMAIASLPFFVYGTVGFLWGAKAARVILFPCAFLVFMIPVAALEQATFRLQFIITGSMGFLAQIFGIGIQAMGTTLTATDGAFHFEVAEGCSGIRSLTAMTMLTAAYVHLTQDRLWKQIVIFACSVLFALVGNIGRIFTVVLFAKYVNPELAAGIVHDYSGWVFFPIAVMAMLSFAKLVNLGSEAGGKLLTSEPKTVNSK